MLAALRRCWPFIWPYRRALGARHRCCRSSPSPSASPSRGRCVIVDDVLDVGGDGAHPANATTILAVAVRRPGRPRARRAVVDYLASRLLQAAGLHIAAPLRVQRPRPPASACRCATTVGPALGDLVARVTSDVAYTQGHVRRGAGDAAAERLLVISMFVVMLAVDPWFTLLALLATPPLVLVTHRSRLRLRREASAVRALTASWRPRRRRACRRSS